MLEEVLDYEFHHTKNAEEVNTMEYYSYLQYANQFPRITIWQFWNGIFVSLALEPENINKEIMAVTDSSHIEQATKKYSLSFTLHRFFV